MDAIKSALIIGFIRALSRLSLSQAQALGVWVGRMMWSFGGRTREVTEKNLELCMPHLTLEQREQMARQSLVETACTMTEAGAAWMWQEQKAQAQLKTVHNGELLDQCMADSRGLIIIVPHIGNWEMLNHYFSPRYVGYGLYRPPKIPGLDRFALERRGGLGLGLRLVPTTRDGVESLYGLLREGEAVYILPDQEPSLKSGVFAPFFGIEALSSKLVPTLQQATGCEVICNYAIRLPDAGGFDVYFRRLEDGYDSADLRTAVTAINRTVELCVETAPEQYQWEYKRFKKRPEGEPKIY